MAWHFMTTSSSISFYFSAIAIYSFPLSLRDEGSWVVEDQPLTESVVRSFVWAQWEPRHNHLYYLHYRPPPEAGLTLGSGQLNVASLSCPRKGLAVIIYILCL